MQGLFCLISCVCVCVWEREICLSCSNNTDSLLSWQSGCGLFVSSITKFWPVDLDHLRPVSEALAPFHADDFDLSSFLDYCSNSLTLSSPAPFLSQFLPLSLYVPTKQSLVPAGDCADSRDPQGVAFTSGIMSGCGKAWLKTMWCLYSFTSTKMCHTWPALFAFLQI